MSYVLITPIKDESENLTRLRETIFKQTFLPVAWVIVDSGSGDDSFGIACTLFQDCRWVDVIRQTKFCDTGYSYKNMSAAINEGYDHAKSLCGERSIEYAFVGKTDATPILKEDYFEKLYSEMENDPKLGLTCGLQQIARAKRIKTAKPVRFLPHSGYNDIRLFKKEFFEEVGGYPLTPSPDAILLVRAVNRGWKTKIVGSTCFLKPRVGGAKHGRWQGNISKGKAMYELGYHPVLFLLSVFFSFLLAPDHNLVACVLGYVLSAVRKENKIDDEEIRNYFWSVRLNEVIRGVLQP